MTQRLVCRGKQARWVVLTEERWAELTRFRRRALLDLPEEAVKEAICAAIADPNIGTYDDHGHCCYYRRRELPPPYDGLFLRVVTKQPHRWTDWKRRLRIEDTKGDVIDVDLVNAPLAGEKTWWPPLM